MKQRYQRYRFIGTIVLFMGAILSLNNLGLVQLSNSSILAIEIQLREFAQADIPQLTEEQELIKTRSELQLLTQENEKLRSLLGFFDTVEYSFIVANVISRDPLNPAILHVDKGSRASVQPGQAVVIGDGFIVGKVLKATPAQSVIELLVSSSSRLAVNLMADELTPGILKGHLGSTLRLEFVSNDATIASGDTIVTSGLDALVPHGLIAGTINKVHADQNELFITADVQPAVDFSQLTVITIVQSP